MGSDRQLKRDVWSITAEEFPTLPRSARCETCFEAGEPEHLQGTVYISGPMSGFVGHNYESFDTARNHAIELGWQVESPADAGPVEGWEWHEYMQRDLDMLSRSTAIVMLPGWQSSEGACIEFIAAVRMGLELYQLEGSQYEGTLKESGNLNFDEGEFEKLASSRGDSRA